MQEYGYASPEDKRVLIQPRSYDAGARLFSVALTEHLMF